MTTSFNRDVCGDFEQATRREWLETNGLGGYASSSLALCNTRRYHGLLVAAVKPPAVRRVLLSKLDLTVKDRDRSYELSANRYPGTVHPTGHRYIESFTTAPWPTWTYAAGHVRLRQEVLMADGHNATIIRVTVLEAPGPVRLEAHPKVTSRDFHTLTHRDALPEVSVAFHEGHVRITWADGRTALFLTHDGAFQPHYDWYYNYVYDRESQRGFDCREDLLCPGTISWELRPGDVATVLAATGPIRLSRAAEWIDLERDRRETERFDLLQGDDSAIALARSTRHFLVRRPPNRWSVIAGYHWFGEWGRDTFISLPGLTLVTGRYDIARSILQTYAESLSAGMMPNRFPDSGEKPEYNSVDSALWFIQALDKYRQYTDDHDFSQEMFPVVREILDKYENGTRFDIHLDEDGLLCAGQAGVQLTWMDAKINDRVVTPRTGKPVEIQALWYRALQVGAALAADLNHRDLAERYAALMRRAESSFERTFWNPANACCYDVIRPDGSGDPSVRPNQILAVSLSPSLLPPHKRKLVVETVGRELLTPMGLRALSPHDPAYVGTYAGDPQSRDATYHQGTVWPWWIGHFVSGFVRVHGRSDQARQQAASYLKPLLTHLQQEGLGHISELADGNEPHAPGGCIAQAWSLAEPLRALCEDVWTADPAFTPRSFAPADLAPWAAD